MMSRTLPAPKESQIERLIGDYLHYKGVCFYKQNTRGYMSGRLGEDKTGRKVYLGQFRKDLNPYARTGLPDYVVIYRGFHIGLEVKTDTGRQSDSQIWFEDYLKTKGQAFYFVVRSVEDCAFHIKKVTEQIDIFWGGSSK